MLPAAVYHCCRVKFSHLARITRSTSSQSAGAAMFRFVCCLPIHTAATASLLVCRFGNQRNLPEAKLQALLMDKLVLENVRSLCQHSLLQTDDDQFGLTALEAGRLMAQHFIRLPTMVQMVQCGPHTSMSNLIQIISKAEEFKNVMLRRYA